MKQIIKLTFQQIIADRAMTLLCIGILLGTVAYIVFVAFNLSPSELQLATRYTSYGETHYYRTRWWELLGFIGFGVLFFIAHVGMLAKLFAIGLKELAYAFAWLSLIILIVMFAYTFRVLNVAY